MVAMKETSRHPVKAAENTSCNVARQAREIGKKPFAVGGIVLLGLGVAAVVYFWPEVHRHLRAERM